jgi:hypothetical protein
MQALKSLVIALGVLILIGAGVVAVTLYKRVAVNSAASPAASAGPGFGTQKIEIPEGAHLDEVIASGDRLILRLRLADGSPRILVVDLITGAPLGELDFAPAP